MVFLSLETLGFMPPSEEPHSWFNIARPPPPQGGEDIFNTFWIDVAHFRLILIPQTYVCVPNKELILSFHPKSWSVTSNLWNAFSIESVLIYGSI